MNIIRNRTLLYFVLGNVFLVVFYLCQLFLFENAGLTTVYVPDGVSWYGFISSFGAEPSEYWQNKVFWANSGLVIFYLLPVYINIVLVFFINLIIVNYVSMGLSSKYGVASIILICFSVPYYWPSLALPSKDILALLITFLSFRYLSNNWNIALLLALACIIVRDGYGIILVAFVLGYRIVLTYRLNLMAILYAFVLGCFVFILLSKYYISDLFIIERNMIVAEKFSRYEITADITSYISYFIRLFGNATNLAFRIQINNIVGGFDVLAVCYWLSGISLLVFIVTSAYLLFCNSVPEDVMISSVFVLSVLLAVSLNPIIQPRYLFATIPVWPSIFGFIGAKKISLFYIGVILASFVSSFMYSSFSMNKLPVEPMFFDYINNI